MRKIENTLAKEKVVKLAIEQIEQWGGYVRLVDEKTLVNKIAYKTGYRNYKIKGYLKNIPQEILNEYRY